VPSGSYKVHWKNLFSMDVAGENSNKEVAPMEHMPTTDWTLIPAKQADIDKVRERCRRLVRKRAAMAAGFSAVPLPGLDVVSDLSLFARLVDEVNKSFGLSAEQVERLQPKFRLIAYEAAVGMGACWSGGWSRASCCSRCSSGSA
jgi:hypothetical protein